MPATRNLTAADKPAARKAAAPQRARTARPRGPATAARGTRERILDAAYGVLHRSGYEKLTQLAVCKAAAITQGHLTYYFPTRASLMLGLAEHCVYREVERLVSIALDGGAAPPHRLAATVAAQLRDRDKPRAMLGLLMAADGDARIRPALQNFLLNARRLVARVLQQCGVEASETNITLLHANLIGLAILNFAYDDRRFAGSLDKAVPALLDNWTTVGART